MKIVAALLALNASLAFGGEPSWSDKAVADLETIREALRANHPAFHTKPEAPERHFLRWFDAGYRQALTRAKAADDYFDYYYTLRAYSLGFDDEHLAVKPYSIDAFKSRMRFRWPGLAIAGNSAGAFAVSFTDSAAVKSAPLPPVGAVLKSCDGKDPERLLKENVFPYYGNGRLLKTRVIFAPRIFVDAQNPFIALPKTCDFTVGKKTSRYPLAWLPIDFGALWPHINPDPLADKRVTAGAHAFGKGGHWVSIPTFYPDEKTAQVFRAVIAEAAKNRGHEVIVFDVRLNGGGSSAWGSDILKGYFSTAYIDSLRDRSRGKSREKFVYRASRRNLDYFKGVLGDAGRNIAKDDPFFKKVVERMEASLRDGSPLAEMPLHEEAPPTALDVASSPVKGRVFVLTDSLCASACLSFLDTILLIPGVTHVGLPTSADAVFMQTGNPVALSDDSISFDFPVLRVQNRPRGHNAPIQPRHRAQGDIYDQRYLEEWIGRLAE